MTSKKKKRSYKRVAPSQPLLRLIEETVLDHMRENDGKEFWTHLSNLIDNVLVNVRDPVHREWVELTNYGRGKVLGIVMDDLKARSIVTRKKNYYPFVLTSVLDRIIMEVDKSGEAEQT